MWIHNGSHISQKYSGTGAMKIDLLTTNKRQISGLLRDMNIGLQRFFLGNFIDYYYQVIHKIFRIV